ncbi:MAG: PEP-CTERM sorting domain-containing protein [Bryobacterales bacterium]|nr:PEP-CTERM sorting domain-containing protein [Bryobacterales bacterium]
MRIIHTLPLALLLSSAMWALPALPITFQDELDSQNSNDVIGNPDYFEIDYLKLTSLSGNTLQVDIRFNYGGGTNLNGFNIAGFAPSLNVGDFFLTTSSNTYAFILNGHDGLATGGLYQITGTQTSRSVLGDPAGVYRPDAPVWAAATGAQLLSTGSQSITTVNGNSTNLLAKLYLPLTASLLNDLNSGFDIYFAAATCGNDEITGTVPASAVPEPGTWMTLGAGLLAIGAYRRKR